jgi:hypothetical protein
LEQSFAACGKLDRATLTNSACQEGTPIMEKPKKTLSGPVTVISFLLLLSIAGAYGMLVLVNEQNVLFDWTFFGALLGAGLYVLKRTFSVD